MAIPIGMPLILCNSRRAVLGSVKLEKPQHAVTNRHITRPFSCQKHYNYQHKYVSWHDSSPCGGCLANQ
eukprot:scaffold559042_cov24-Prasinocladus_malaysianus.AAC.1